MEGRGDVQRSRVQVESWCCFSARLTDWSVVCAHQIRLDATRECLTTVDSVARRGMNGKDGKDGGTGLGSTWARLHSRTAPGDDILPFCRGVGVGVCAKGLNPAEEASFWPLVVAKRGMPPTTWAFAVSLVLPSVGNP